MDKEKTLFVVISKDVIRRNILDTDFFPKLRKETNGACITLVVEEEKIPWYEEQYKDEDVAITGYKRKPHRGVAKFVNYLVRTAGNTHSMRTYRNRSWKRGDSSFFSYAARAFISNTVGGLGWYQEFVRFLVSVLPSSPDIKVIYDKYKPSMVFAPSLIDNDFDVLIANEARKRNIQVVGMVRSWDNFNNHGLLAFVPDVLVLQNSFLRDTARKYQHLSSKKTHPTLVGLPHYDLYADVSPYIKPREEFLESFGIDPNKKLILLGGSDFYYSEDELPNILNSAIENNEIIEPAHVIFRPHPGSIFDIEEYGLDKLQNVTLDDAFSGKQKFSDTDKFINLLYHADVIINICSTLSIDAAVMERPAIAINFDSKDKALSYHEQVGRLYDQFDHYEELVRMDGTALPGSKEELVEVINGYFENPRKDRDGQEKILKRFVGPVDGKAGERLASTVSDIFNKRV